MKICNLFLNINGSQLIYGYKRHAYKKDCILAMDHPMPQI